MCVDVKPLRRLDRTFLDSLVGRFVSEHKDEPGAQHMRYLLDPDCKRVLFDARQAVAFAELATPPPGEIRHQLRMPFPLFYMEFTEPVTLPPDLWGVESGQGLLRAMIVAQGPLRAVYQPPTVLVTRKAKRLAKPVIAMAFISTPDEDMIAHRIWRLDLDTGDVYVQRADVSLEERASGLFGPALADPSTGLDNVEEDEYYPVGFDSERRHVGWWERAALAGGALVSWCLAYMMAKSIVLEVEQPHLSRKARRRAKREGLPLPKPWHVVKVDPKYRQAREAGQQPGSSHSYRYDVIGHLRYNRHRVGPRRPDGRYEMRETIEWVPPHQRGLGSALYMPKTYAVEAGRKVPRELRGPQAGPS